MAEKTKTVAIIGAGAAGIVSARTAVEAGIHPTVFERSSFFGGVWSPTGLGWTRMHTNVGNYILAFSDFPWPRDSLIFPSKSDVYQYLLNYVEKFKIQDRFRLNTKVEAVKLLDDKRWQITSVCGDQRFVEIFDYCVISSGFNSQPHMPDEYEEGREIFSGVVMHSAEYTSDDNRLKGKKVIVVGSSYTAVEVASDLNGHASSILNLFRTKYLVLPKIIPETIGQGKVKLSSIDASLYSRRCFYVSSEGKVNDPYYEKNIYSAICPIQTDRTKSNPELFIDLETIDLADIKSSLSDVFLDLVQSNKIDVKQGVIKSYRPNGIVTDDETFFEADAIVFCTSNKMDLTFFGQTTLRRLNYDGMYLNDPIGLYKNTWHPDLPNMGFVGMVESGIFIVGELQAKWIFKVFEAKLTLPSRDIMIESIQKQVEKREKNRKIQYPYHFNYLCDMIASEAGLLDLEEEKRLNPDVYELLWTGPILPEHFQLNHPDKRQSAIEQIKFVNARFNRIYSQEEADAVTVYNYV